MQYSTITPFIIVIGIATVQLQAQITKKNVDNLHWPYSSVNNNSFKIHLGMMDECKVEMI